MGMVDAKVTLNPLARVRSARHLSISNPVHNFEHAFHGAQSAPSPVNMQN